MTLKVIDVVKYEERGDTKRSFKILWSLSHKENTFCYREKIRKVKSNIFRKKGHRNLTN